MAPIRSKRSSIRARAVKARPTESRGGDAPGSRLHSSQDRRQPAVQQSSEPIGSSKRKRDVEDDGNDATSWRLNKRDKRTIKHNVFLAKVRDSGVQKKKPLKRRRPANKLKADIGGLADALPAVEGGFGGSEDGDEWEGMSDDEDNTPQVAVDGRRKRKGTEDAGKMVMTSLRRRPGALKRKKKMEDAEMDRFRRNLAQMAAGSAAGDKPAVAAFGDRWASLRSFIGTTMQQDKAFKGD